MSFPNPKHKGDPIRLVVTESMARLPRGMAAYVVFGYTDSSN